MFAELLPAFEKGIMDTAGSIPVVFKGMERSFESAQAMLPASAHEFHELTYVRSGKAVFHINNRAVCVEQGTTIIIYPQTSHQIEIKSGPADMIVLYFGFSRQPDLADQGQAAPVWMQKIAPQTLEQFLDFAYGNDNTDVNWEGEPYLLLHGKSRKEMSTIIEQIFLEKDREAYGRALMMRLLTMELLVVLARGLREEWEENLRVRTGKVKELVEVARNYMIDNHDRDISISDVASYVFLSQGYFARAFRDEMNISPMSFLMQVRVEHALKLLTSRDIKVSAVARHVGFSSPQRFNAAFRKHVGMTPMQYQRSKLKMRDN